MSDAVALDYVPRAWQKKFHAGVRGKRHGVAVVGRQSGKTHSAVFEMISRAINGPAGAAYALVMPYQSQVRRILWPRLKGALQPLGNAVSFRETDLIATLPGDVKIYAVGADNEIARGFSFRGILVDEFDNISIDIWKSVFMPTLTAHGSESWTLFIGTLSGSASRLWKMVEEHRDDPAWHVQVTPASEIVEHDPEFLKTQRQMMGETAYLREYECDPSAPVERSVLGDLMADCHSDGRMVSLPIQRHAITVASFDLGIRDFTSVWVAQLIGQWVELVAFHEYGGLGLEDVIIRLARKNYPLRTLILPHDVKARDMGSGHSRLRLFQNAGIGRPQVLKRGKTEDSLHNARSLLPKCKFDPVRCELGINRLKQVQYEFDSKSDTVLNKVKHNDASHAFDSFRYLADWIAKHYPSSRNGRDFQSRPESSKVIRTIRPRRRA